MYFSRGNPVVYYGDEQGFTGRRRRPGRAPDDVREQGRRRTSTTTCSARMRPTRATTSSRRTRSTRTSAALAALTKANPALRDGAQQVRVRLRRPGRLRLLPHRPEGAARVRRRAQQQRDGAVREHPDIRREADLLPGLRHGAGKHQERRRHPARRGRAGPVDGRVRVERPHPDVEGCAGDHPRAAGAVRCRPGTDARGGRRRRLVLLRGHLPGEGRRRCVALDRH